MRDLEFEFKQVVERGTRTRTRFSSESFCHSKYLAFTAIVCSFSFNGLNYFQFFTPGLFSYSLAKLRLHWTIRISCLRFASFHSHCIVPLSSFCSDKFLMPIRCRMELMDALSWTQRQLRQMLGASMFTWFIYAIQCNRYNSDFLNKNWECILDSNRISATAALLGLGIHKGAADAGKCFVRCYNGSKHVICQAYAVTWPVQNYPFVETMTWSCHMTGVCSAYAWLWHFVFHMSGLYPKTNWRIPGMTF